MRINRKRIVALILAFVLVCMGLCSCGETTMVGAWVCKETVSGYPERMVLNEDGTIDDTVFVTWDAESAGILIFFTEQLGLNVELDSYEYKLKGSKLHLDGYEYIKK